MNTTTTSDFFRAGYCKSPNNIHNLPGDGWYAQGPGKPQPIRSQEIRMIDGKLSVWATKYYNRPDGSGFMFSISGIVAEFENIEEMQAWCLINGMTSEPGLPAGIWGWD
jgi:hypothetical protein